MKICYFQACCRQWSLDNQESDLQPIPTLLPAQQSERCYVLSLVFKASVLFPSVVYSNARNFSSLLFPSAQSWAEVRSSVPTVPAQTLSTCTGLVGTRARCQGAKELSWHSGQMPAGQLGGRQHVGTMLKREMPLKVYRERRHRKRQSQPHSLC